MKLTPCSFLLLAVIILMLDSPSFACNVCHSKNPKMVNMHRALGFKDCFTCHGPRKKTSSQDRESQMMNDPLCINCHKR